MLSLGIPHFYSNCAEVFSIYRSHFVGNGRKQTNKKIENINLNPFKYPFE